MPYNKCKYTISTCLITSSSFKRNVVQCRISLVIATSNSVNNYLEKERERNVTAFTRHTVSSQGEPTILYFVTDNNR